MLWLCQFNEKGMCCFCITVMHWQYLKKKIHFWSSKVKTILVMTPKIKIFTVMKGLTIDEGQRCSRRCRRTYSIIAGTPVGTSSNRPSVLCLVCRSADWDSFALWTVQSICVWHWQLTGARGRDTLGHLCDDWPTKVKATQDWRDWKT